VSTWFGFFAPAHTPSPIVDRLNQELIKALRSPTLNANLLKLGLEVITGSPQALAGQISRDAQTWLPVVRKIGLRLDH
jgi:tripartite-type tricarboxylate transporter receptor subunit TctC